MKHLFASLLGLFSLSLAACASDVTTEDGDESELQSKSSSVVAGNREFAADLYKAIAQSEKGNIFFSPHSVSTALAMTYAGARGSTANAMSKTLHLPTSKVAEGFKALADDLDKRAAQAKGLPGETGSGFELGVANSLWGEKTLPFNKDFLSLLKNNYGAGLEGADFKNKADQERVRINSWVEGKTNDKIRNLIPDGSLTSDTRLVLVNAIYFKASWSTPFSESRTAPATFVTLEGKKIQVPTMHGQEHMKYAKGADYEAVAVPYLGGNVELLAVLPKGNFATYESGLTAKGLEGVYASLRSRQVDLSIPKFKIDGASVSLTKTLTKLGMGVAFSDDANFSGISKADSFAISDVLHKAFVDLNEKGTEAAAATAVLVARTTSIEVEPAVQVKLDRPFFFAVRDVPTGEILFMGRMANPS